MADLLNLRVSATTIHAPNPRITVMGGPGIDSIVFVIVSSGAIGYIAGRFFDHISDRVIGTALTKIVDALRSRRRGERHMDELPWFTWTFTNSTDEDHVEELTFVGRFESADELARLAREARELIGTYGEAGFGGQRFSWSRTDQRWSSYDPEADEPQGG